MGDPMTSITVGEGFTTAVLLPCHNVGATIGAVVRGFAAALPGARIFVFDNNSTDDTAREAAHAGARVFRESRHGRGAVLRRMFADIEADVYVMAAGDGSSDPADAPSLVNALITEHVDMVVGRAPKSPDGRDVTAAAVGGQRGAPAGLREPSSAYRAFTRRFVKSFPAVSDRLSIETEMSLHASQLMIPVAEIELTGARPAASGRKAAEFSRRDSRVLAAAALLRETQPAAFYGLLAAMFAIVGALLLVAQLSAAGEPADVSRLVLGTGLLVIAAVLGALGLLMERIDRARIEQKRNLFLAVPALGAQ